MNKDIYIIFDGEKKPLTSLLTHFDYHLKREEGISGFEKAKKKREEIINSVRKFINNMGKNELTVDELYSKEAETGKERNIQYFYNFLRFKGYGPSETKEIEEREEREETAEVGKRRVEETKFEPPVIGRVALTLKSPAKPSEFTFWVTEDKEIKNKLHAFPIEPGRLVSVTSEEKDVQVLGIISDVETHADIESPTESFYGHGVGNPEIEMPTNPVVITSAKVEVVYRSDRKAEPLMGQWKVRPATDDEIRKAYGSEISDTDEVIIGFGYDWRGNPVPIPAHIRHIIGYEAAHINISGTAGAATKTSYALFLLFSILSYSKHPERDKVAAIAFNVKEADLLRIDELPAWEEIDKWSRSGPNKQHAELWKLINVLQEPYSINPLELKDKDNFKFYAPERSDGKKATLRDPKLPTTGFQYAALDLAETRSLHLLLDPEDLDDKSVAVLWSLMDEIKEKKLSFEEALKRLSDESKSQKWEAVIGDVPHHRDTINKVRNRAENAVRYQLTELLVQKDRQGKPIPIWNLKAGDLWVIDISRLHDKGQRLLFHWIMRALHDFLEKKRSGQTNTAFLNNSIDLRNFPDKVVVFVDELNKFAPSGAGTTAIKRDIVEIAARGRSIGLSLIGAQQLASKVDEEILANTSTFAVGRSHPVEIGKPTYGWLPTGLKERATILERGWMIVWHGVHRRPVFIRFPKPLHQIKVEQEKL